jgi:hypothetical protein
MADPGPSYQPFYCEENIWRLAQDPRCGEGERLVALITGGEGNFAMWHQRPASGPGEPLVWDYHVVLLVDDRAWRVWDFECDLGMPLPAEAWLYACFPHQDHIPRRYRPWFRVMRAGEYIDTLCSDRSHMRDAGGRYLEAPPAWAPPGNGGSNLARFIDPKGDFIGEVVDLTGLRRRLEEPPGHRP